jgi:Fe-S oxidoreductase
MSESSDPRLCALCPKLCRFACPVATGTADEGATPTAMLQAAGDARAGRIPWSEAAETLEKCTGCEACRAPCEFDQEVPSLLYAARAEAFEAGQASEAAQRLHAVHLEYGNPFGKDLHAAIRKHAREDRDFDRKGRVLLWPGCRMLAERPEAAAAAMDLFHDLGADHMSLPARSEVPCCGAPLQVVGDQAGLEVAAASLQQYFNRQRTWVTPSSRCLLTVRHAYQAIEQDIRAELLHAAEYLLFFKDALGDRGKAVMDGFEERGEPVPHVVVHDACGLHRRVGAGAAVYEVVEVLMGSRPPSMSGYPDRTGCCGAGDFHDLRRPAAAKAVGAHSARQAAVKPGTWIVTGDSDCVGALRGAYPDAQVHDILGFAVAWTP